MAEQVIRRQVDDLERLRGNPGVDADEQVVFGLDGKSYVIDLSTANAEGLRKMLGEYVNAARPLFDRESKKQLSPAQAKRAELEEVRRWAEGQGIRVNRRGRIPQSILDNFELANGRLRHQ
jgi:nucleoid-associated protein Lsr2